LISGQLKSLKKIDLIGVYIIANRTLCLIILTKWQLAFGKWQLAFGKWQLAFGK
jgi:hypothetical protein